MSKRSDRLLLHDILHAINKIETYIANMVWKTFEEDAKTADAVIRNLEIIGEASVRLSSEFRIGHPTIEWRKIAGLRNRIVHAYFGVDLAIIWQILQKDIPNLKIGLQEALNHKIEP
ncbi:DUF86 domain-containing protein [bacterium]|nr:DUF86 domain-containing protein [bacterium]